MVIWPFIFQHYLSARLWPNKEHRYMGLMENTECYAAQHQLFQPGITVGPNDDHVHTFFLSVFSDFIGRPVTLQ